ncbi:DUF58 domain-containing protein [Bryobacter aggregatus]|uniref:DUF58 domain-containing protein n=1 Tax=Bryobacter aggregatus TaxID=360054 RepID=UPI0004E1AB3C|nr:DUF58 domain-containing protein [Bryobacter aggregatus]
MQQNFLDPQVLAAISGLDLVAKTVVQGFVNGLHRSPDFGFSQEFAEYRMYTPGDDLRSVDWNVYARTDRIYLKRYRGETNTRMTVLLDLSKSMSFGAKPNKLDYSRFLVSSLLYLAVQQRDAAGLILFDDEVRQFIPPSSRVGQLQRLLHAVEHAEVGQHTDFSKPFRHFLELIRQRGLVIVVSDFYAKPEEVIETISPLRWKNNEVVLFHILDRQELEPSLTGPATMIDIESGEAIEVTPEYVKTEYRAKMDAHIEDLRSRAQGAGMDYFLMPTDKPLDAGLREYLAARQGRM